MKKYEIGTRVEDNFLGQGEIVEQYTSGKELIGHIVLFDVAPPLEYNISVNPCLIIHNNLKEMK